MENFGRMYKIDNTGYNSAYQPINGESTFFEGLDNMFTGNQDWLRQTQLNAFNAQEAAKQRDFEEYMANTSYQRAFADMRKAGLNPNLIYSNGGAATPSGASAVSASRNMSNNYGFNLLTKLLLFAIGQTTTSANSLAQTTQSLMNKDTAAMKLNTSKNYLKIAELNKSVNSAYDYLDTLTDRQKDLIRSIKIK